MPASRHVELRRAQCLTWAVASRARLEAALSGGPLPIPTGTERVDGILPAAGREAARPTWPADRNRRADADRETGDALRRRGDLYLGIVALDQALTAARWAAGAAGERTRTERSPTEEPDPSSPRAAGLPMPLGALEAARQRVRAVRNLVVHLDDRLAASLPATLTVDAAGLRASQGRRESGIEFAEWIAWLDALEAWASHPAEAMVEMAGGEPDRAP